MVFTRAYDDTKPLHPLKRSQKAKLRKEEEKKRKEEEKKQRKKAKFLNELKYKGY